ncbi:PREDICTED: adhesion G-protein coupled receptor G2-like [Priapulus caudatus]|uniref:Adhesion G-protein coupled receptor G2-like n=1 Tax=Priapulus caudatus TaxID=37621 RepID=A0ABM1F4Z3_PRICU|nr:PREDICTED: adhesion G-protein coupled receptor G2-like [Priapulus caudatus]
MFFVRARARRKQQQQAFVDVAVSFSNTLELDESILTASNVLTQSVNSIVNVAVSIINVALSIVNESVSCQSRAHHVHITLLQTTKEEEFDVDAAAASLSGLTEDTDELTAISISYIADVIDNIVSIKVLHLLRPLYIQLPGENDGKPTCVFWDHVARDGVGDWSESGCWGGDVRDGKFVCYCEHLTNFAVLLDVNVELTVPDVHARILSIISIVGCVMSIVGLSCTILTFAMFRKVRTGKSQLTLLHLAVALLCLLVIFLVGIELTDNYVGCVAVAVLLHYFTLAAFMWMLVEGFLHYLRYVKVLGTYVPGFMWKACLLAWGLPLVLVVIMLAADSSLYKGSDL